MTKAFTQARRTSMVGTMDRAHAIGKMELRFKLMTASGKKDSDTAEESLQTFMEMSTMASGRTI